MRRQFITFLTCSFDDHWEFFNKNVHTSGQTWDMEKFTKLVATSHDSSVNIVDASKREIRMKFKSTSYVGISDGMLYCDADDVKDTQVGRPMTQ